MSDDTAWRFCPKCGETKAKREFYNDSKKTRSACRACANIKARKKYASRLAFVQSYKLERGCVDCGYKGHPAALEFDHLPQFEKTHTISQLVPRMSVPHECPA